MANTIWSIRRDATVVRRSGLCVGAVVAVLLLGSCRDAGDVIGPGQQGHHASFSQGDVRGLGTVPLARFAVEVSASGTFRPGEPVSIRTLAQGVLDTREVEIRVVAPDVAAARAGQWSALVWRIGERTSPEANWVAPLQAGGRFERQTTLLIPKPGYYRVILSALKKSDEPSLVKGRPVADVAHAEVWLWIADRGGRATKTFERTLFPEGVRTQPGILCPTSGRACSRTPNQKSEGISVQSQSDIWFFAKYYNRDVPGDDPLPEAQVYVDAYDANGSPVYTQYLFTDATGVAGPFPCVPGGTYIAQVWTWNGKLQVIPRVAVGVYSGYFDYDCGFPMPIDTDAPPSHVFRNMVLTYNAAQSHFMRSRPWMEVELTADGPDASSYCPDARFSGCTRNDYVRIQTRTNTIYGEQVWGTFGVFVQAHEYGHAYHEKALGEFVWYSYGDGASCPSIHTFYDPAPRLECALAEAFATYFAVATRGSDAGSWERDVEVVHQAAWGGTDGSLIEASIAGFFYDLTDNNRFGTEAHDAVQYPGSYVADIILSCDVNPAVRQDGTTGWGPDRGIDHLAYCFQRDMTGSTTHFQTRTPTPLEQDQATGISDPVQVKRLWRMNLYRESV
jgi:hypothetical protein